MSRFPLATPLLARLGVCLLLLFLSVLSGCDQRKSQRTGASVSGVVRHKGEVVTGGTIRLFSDNNDGNHSAQGKIKGDGTYQILNAPVGKCKVVVDTKSAKFDMSALRKMIPETERAKLPPEPPGPPVKYMPIDAKYSDLKKTDVEITIQEGGQTQDVNLP